MLLGFIKMMKAPILKGTKIHTIREDKGERWYEGVKIHMCTGARTKHCDVFKSDEVCTGTQEVFMSYDWMLHISIDDRELYHPEKELLAKNDGFETYADFEAFFLAQCNKKDDNTFSGRLIHWTDFRYTETTQSCLVIEE